MKNGKIWSKKHKCFIGTDNGFGYLIVPTNPSTKRIHRIIWECTNGEIPDGYDIHHIDGNKLNNSIYNLELIEKSKHIREHKKGVHRSEETKRKISENNAKPMLGKKTWNYGKNNLEYCSKPVLQIDKKTKEIIAEFPSAKEVERILGYNQGHISNVCNNKPQHKSAYGFIWKFKY